MKTFKDLKACSKLKGVINKAEIIEVSNK